MHYNPLEMTERRRHWAPASTKCWWRTWIDKGAVTIPSIYRRKTRPQSPQTTAELLPSGMHHTMMCNIYFQSDWSMSKDMVSGPTYLLAELECKKDDDNLELAESRLSSMEFSSLLLLLHASGLRCYGGRSWTGREADFNTIGKHYASRLNQSWPA